MIDNEIYKDLYTSLFERRFVQKPSQESTTGENHCCGGGNGRMVAFAPRREGLPVPAVHAAQPE